MRRARGRRETAIWPGFVDAMTGLLLVLMFVLTIFTVVQFALRDQISGQATQLDDLGSQVLQLTAALGLARDEEAAVAAELTQAEEELRVRSALIDRLTGERDAQAFALSEAGQRITGFEAQVAGLLAERAQARDRVASLEADVAAEMEESDQLSLALAAARTEIDERAEAARLAAARADALDALARSLRNDTAEDGEALAEAEALRLTESAAAEALRARLEGADAELTAMTLALEEERRAAEETLTLLAAANAAREGLDIELAAAILARDAAEAGRAQAEAAQTEVDERLLAALSLQETTAAERDAARAELDAAEAEGADLSTRLAAALAARDDSVADLTAVRAALAESEVSREEVESRLAQAVLAQSAAEAAQVSSAEALAAAEAEGQDLATRLAEAVLRQTEAEEAAARATEATRAGDDDLRARLAEAIEASNAARAEAGVAATEAERQAALLATAQTQLAGEEAASAESQRAVAALTEQVATLRNEVATLQTLLDISASDDLAADVQIESLGADLNTALARVASEERARAELEAAERERLQAEAERLIAEARDLESYRSEFFGSVRSVLEGEEGVQVVGDRFVFSSEVVFQSGGATLSQEGRAQIARVAALLRRVIDDIPPEVNWVIRVDGHTDDTPLSGQGAYRSNWELSQARALSVVLQMAEVEGIPPERLSANGFGEFQPLDRSGTEEGRARNRRIEIKLTER